MWNSTAAAASARTDTRPRRTTRPVRHGQLVHIDPLCSERVAAVEETTDGLVAARGILTGIAAGLAFWTAFALALRALWATLAG